MQNQTSFIYNMKFNLYGRQRVLVHCNKITFCHRHFHFITLTRRQFDNLNDMIRDRNKIHIKSYPLGNRLWIYREKDSFCFSSHDAYFLFYQQSWKRYIRQIHPRICQILRRHGRAERYQYIANDEVELIPRPRKFTSYTRRQTFPRSSRNAIATSEQWQECATVSRGNDTNPRRHRLGRSGEDATRDPPSPMSVDNDTINDFEHGGDYSIDEPELAKD